MKNPFDQLAKRLGKAALDPSGPTAIQHEIVRDAQHADLRHDPDPACGAARARLGLLGRMAEVLCLMEVFSHAPTAEEIRACLGKHFAHGEEHATRRRSRDNKRRAKGLPPEPLVEPRLWILTPAVSTPILRRLGAQAASGWPRGVHFVGGDVLHVGVVVASELPRDRSTLLVRLMAAGPGLPGAIRELAALPEDAHERAVAEGIVLRLQSGLLRKPDRAPEEEEFIVAVLSTWKEARAEGRALGRAEALLTVLRSRAVAVPHPERERILAEKDPARIERWIERACTATSLADVLDDSS